MGAGFGDCVQPVGVGKNENFLVFQVFNQAYRKILRFADLEFFGLFIINIGLGKS